MTAIADQHDQGVTYGVPTIELGADESAPPTILLTCPGCRDSHLLPIDADLPPLLLWWLVAHQGHVAEG